MTKRPLNGKNKKKSANSQIHLTGLQGNRIKKERRRVVARVGLWVWGKIVNFARLGAERVQVAATALKSLTFLLLISGNREYKRI